MIHDKSIRTADALMLLLVMIWGFNFVIVKAAIMQFLPLTFNGIRFITASLALLLIAFGRGINLRVTWREVWILTGLGALHTTSYQILFIEGIARTTAGNAAMILAGTPVIVAVGNYLFGYEQLNRTTWLGVIVAFGGLYLVVSGGEQGLQFEGANLSGNLLVLGATLMWSVYTILAKPMLSRYSSLSLTILTTVFGSIPLVLWCLPSMIAQNWNAATFASWSGVILSGLLAIAIAYLIWNNSVSKIGSTKTALYSNLTPIVAVIASAFFLNEQMSGLQMFGSMGVIGGVVLARWKKRNANTIGCK